MKTLAVVLLLSLPFVAAGCGWCDRPWHRGGYPQGCAPHTYQYPYGAQNPCCPPVVTGPQQQCGCY